MDSSYSLHGGQALPNGIKGKHAAPPKRRRRFPAKSIVIAIFVLACLGIFLFRVIHGVDFTDESFYVSMGLRLVKGNSIFADMWEQSSTSALLPSFLLRAYMHFFGTNGIVAFYRLAFFVVNLLASVVLFIAFRLRLGNDKAVLISLAYLVFAPFHIYSFSYNNCADMFLMLMIAAWLIYRWSGKAKWIFFSGVFCTLLVLTYPTMIALSFIMVIYALITERKNGFLFLGGVLLMASVLFIAIVSQIGFSGLKVGLDGILSDPAYGQSGNYFLDKVQKGLLFYFEPVVGNHPLLQIFYIWMVALFFLRRKIPFLNLSLIIYPIIAFIDIEINGYDYFEVGMFMLEVGFIAPFLPLYSDKFRPFLKELLAFMWVPSFLFYVIIAMSSAGGGGQGVQGLVMAALMTVIEISCISDEVLEHYAVDKSRIAIKIPGLLVIALFAVFQLYAYCNVAYRDIEINRLSEYVDSGPYAGLFTTPERKAYIDELNSAVKEIREKDENALVLYHNTFLYLFLDMEPFAPTVWGLYPHIDNEDVYKKYFDTKKALPDNVYIINVPENLTQDFHNEENYGYAVGIKNMLDKFYNLEQEIPVGDKSIKKYVPRNSYDEIAKDLDDAFNHQ